MRISTCFGDRTRSGVRDQDNYKESTDNFMNVFSNVSSPCVLSYCCVLRYFLTIPVGFNFNLGQVFQPKMTAT